MAGPFKMKGSSFYGHGNSSPMKDVKSVTNADGSITKTRTRRDGSVKSVKTYTGDKLIADKVVKYRKGGTKKKEVVRPGDKSGAQVTKFGKKGEVTGSYNKKERAKKIVTGAAKVGLTGAAIAANPGVGLALAKGAVGYGKYVTGALGVQAAGGIRDKITKAGKWAKKGVKNVIQTGKRKGNQ